jgi:predicted nucleic-acid-binding protein
MKAVDTNVLVRFLVGDDIQQAKKVYRIFKKAESEKESFLVPLLVVLELLWVLESVYEIPKSEIIDSINELMLMPILKFESQGAIRQFLLSAQNGKFDLSDLLIAHSAKTLGCVSVITFDKKASKHLLFELIK